MKIAFHCNQLSISGTEVATFDYAYFNQTLLNNESIIIAKNNPQYDFPNIVDKFNKQFNVIRYNNFSEVEKILDDNHVDIFYALKSGENDGIVSKGRKSCIHVVFKAFQPHGKIYAYISEWLAKEASFGLHRYVPHMIHLPSQVEENYREKLNIPKEATVFGRYGSYNEFNIFFVNNSIKKILDKRKDVWFLFANTPKFYEHERIIYLDPIYDVVEKVKFINTCDAMIHARARGETFGIACGEFSVRNKPVLTYGMSPEKAHIDMLGEKGLYYYNEQDLNFLFNHFVKDETKDWDAYSEKYNYIKVMEKFKKVFL